MKVLAENEISAVLHNCNFRGICYIDKQNDKNAMNMKKFQSLDAFTAKTVQVLSLFTCTSLRR